MRDAGDELGITVVYDNYPDKEGLETGWGFCAYIRGGEKNVLFDTGPAGWVLRNMKELAIEPGDIDTVVLSHFHPDHTGGAVGLVEAGSDMTVYGPKALPKGLKDSITGGGAKMVEVEESLEICRGVYTTGQVGGRIKEQSLVLRTAGGLIVIVGCGHPGIVKMVTAAKDLLEDDVLLVIGGFHLEWATKGKIERVISAFRDLGVRYVGPGHCSGEKGRRFLEEHFGPDYVKIGAGKTINVADLK